MTDDGIDEGLKEKWVEVLNPYNGELIIQEIGKLADLTKSFETRQNVAHMLKYRGKFCFVIGRYEQALADMTKLLEFETNNAFALRYRGETYYMMERYEESLTDLDKLLEIDTNNMWALKAYEEITNMYIIVYLCSFLNACFIRIILFL